MSILSSVVSTAGQIAIFTTNTLSIGFRSLRIYQTYHDPNISSTSRWASIALNTASVATQTASYSSSLEDKQIEQLTAVSNVTSFGSDMIHVMGDENATTTSTALIIAKFLSTTNQARGGRKNLSDFIHIAEAVAFCYENRNKIGEQIQKLKNKRKINRKKLGASTLDTQKEYQDLLLGSRKKYPNKTTDLNIFLFARGCIVHEEAEVKFNKEECTAIIQGKKITNLRKVPYILKEEFQDRICSISKKPIYTVVAIQESADSKPIYYEWSNLVKSVQNEKIPKNWPKAMSFGPEAVVVDHLGTKNIQDRLKKAALKPNITKRAQAALKQLDKRKKSLETMKALSLADIIECKIDEECIELIDNRLLTNTELNIEELRRNECSQ